MVVNMGIIKEEVALETMQEIKGTITATTITATETFNDQMKDVMAQKGIPKNMAETPIKATQRYTLKNTARIGLNIRSLVKDPHTQLHKR